MVIFHIVMLVYQRVPSYDLEYQECQGFDPEPTLLPDYHYDLMCRSMDQQKPGLVICDIHSFLENGPVKIVDLLIFQMMIFQFVFC